MVGAVFGEIWNDSRSAKCYIFPVTCRVMVGSCSDHGRVMLGRRINHEIDFSWQAQYLVRLVVDISCPTHCK